MPNPVAMSASAIGPLESSPRTRWPMPGSSFGASAPTPAASFCSMPTTGAGSGCTFIAGSTGAFGSGSNVSSTVVAGGCGNAADDAPMRTGFSGNGAGS